MFFDSLEVKFLIGIGAYCFPERRVKNLFFDGGMRLDAQLNFAQKSLPLRAIVSGRLVQCVQQTPNFSVIFFEQRDPVCR